MILYTHHIYRNQRDLNPRIGTLLLSYGRHYGRDHNFNKYLSYQFLGSPQVRAFLFTTNEYLCYTFVLLVQSYSLIIINSIVKTKLILGYFVIYQGHPPVQCPWPKHIPGNLYVYQPNYTGDYKMLIAGTLVFNCQSPDFRLE